MLIALFAAEDLVEEKKQILCRLWHYRIPPIF